MSRKAKIRYFACDFETTVYDSQEFTEVWSAASVELYTEDVRVQGCIDDFFKYLFSLDSNLVCYFHNLKFDGNFIIPYLIKKNFKQAIVDDKLQSKADMPNKSFVYNINFMGSWYWIRIKYNHKFIEIRDSLKLLPYSLKEIGKGFNTKHQKLTMNYRGLRYANCTITEDEMEYIKNDVLVLKEGLEFMFNEGHDKLTIGSCCMEEFKSSFLLGDYDIYFPNVYEIDLPPSFGYNNVGEYIHASYHGGWCYFVEGKSNRVLQNGCTNDVNSLYPSMMHSQSGNKYPVGKPFTWKGNYIPEIAQDDKHYYFVRIKTRFYLKENRLPCIQIKHNKLYKGNEWLQTSDIFSDGLYYRYIVDEKTGNLIPTIVEMVLTETDLTLIKDQYRLEDFEILDGIYFNAEIGIFDRYINKYKQLKMTSKGARRQEAKLFLNNLYGKLAANTDSSYKIIYMGEDKVIHFRYVEAHDKKPGYIPCGSAITSYARNFTIRAAQENYYGSDKPGFCYADTDSIHCDLPPTEIKGIVNHPTEFCCWKCESTWDAALFTRQKTYLEHIIQNDLEDCEPYWDVKAAGMPAKANKIFTLSLERYESRQAFMTEHAKEIEDFDLNEKEIDYIMSGKEISDFRVGLKVPGSLKQTRIKGGVVLIDREYEMKGSVI